SHSAVNSGDVNFGGASSSICFPLEVTLILPSRDSIEFILNNFSMISALVATVPIPSVSFIVYLYFLLFILINFCVFFIVFNIVFYFLLCNLKNFCVLSIAINNVPSLKYEGGIVSWCSILACVICNLDDFVNFSICSFTDASVS